MLLVLMCAMTAVRQMLRPRGDLVLENLALRHQLRVLTRNSSRPTLQPADRLLWSWLSRLWPEWRRHIVIVRPDTVLRWHRFAWRRYWSWRSRGRRPGRPRIDPELAELIRRMTRENPRWSHMRVLGELRKLGFRVSLQTVRRYRRDVPRDPWQSWRTFLTNHRPQIWASDFFTVQTLMFQTLYVFFFIAHGRRPIVHFNVTDHPKAEWVWRQLIEATPWGEVPRFLIRDRDRSYGGSFVTRARASGIETVLTPIATPQANGIAERLVGTLRRECLDHLIVMNEWHLRRVLREFAAHYNDGRPHRTLELTPPSGPAGSRHPPERHPRVRSRAILGGLTHEYTLDAA
jgi:transposase InsO family protein